MLDTARRSRSARRPRCAVDPAVLEAYLGADRARACLRSRTSRPLRARRRGARASRSTVEPGEIVALVGPNGAGKSTTLDTRSSACSGRARARSSFEGDPLVGRDPERDRPLGLALVPEGRHIFARSASARTCGSGATTRPTGRVAADIERAARAVPGPRRRTTAVRGRPVGRRAAAARDRAGAARRPRLLLLDEPSLGLAPLVIDLVFDVLAELRDRA